MNFRPASLSSVFLLLLGCGLIWNERARPAGEPPSEPAVTFNRDVAPVVFRSCAPCHHPGEAGPFSLLTYADVKTHARQIAFATRKKIMPPWLPEPGEFPLADDLHLEPEEIALFETWVAAGAPEGRPEDLPRAPQFATGWQLGKPDVILKAAKPYLLPAAGSDMYWNFIFRPPGGHTRYVKAIEIRPGEKRLVHHANLLVDRSLSARRQEKSPGSGFPGMELQIVSEAFDPDGHFLFWKPGTLPEPEPPGMALRLDRGNELVLNTHLQPSGKPETIQPSIGIYYTDVPATKFPVLLQLENDRALDIPAGEKNFVVTDEFVLPVGADLLAIYPHAHYLCRDMLAYAKFPDGTEKTLLHIVRWDLNWQAVFRYKAAVPLPAGTTLGMRYSYDNSSENPANPQNPPVRVTAGNRASDEMAHLWLQVLPREDPQTAGDPRMKIQEALARHHVGTNPDDFAAHYNLGAMLQARGALLPAIEEYTRALQLRPGDATVQNSLGGALLAAGRLGEAIEQLRRAAAARPDYFDARYNLGNALAAAGDFERALREFQAAVRLSPEDAGAETNLGSALAELGRTEEARLHFRRALALDPSYTLARENLDALGGKP